MGVLHAGIFNALPDCHVVAICEKERLQIRLAKSLVPERITFYRDSVRMVEEEELDGVVIATPIGTHVPIAADLAKTNSKLSIFIEKPLAPSANQAQLACEAISKLTGIHMVGFQKRFSPVFQQAKQFIKNGSIGDLMFFRAHSFSSDVLRQGDSWRFKQGSGGVLLDLAPHLVDMLLWFFDIPSSVFAVTKRLFSRSVDDYVHAVMSYESGLKGYFDACWSISSYRLPEIWIEVHGKNGTMTLTDDFVKLELESKRKDEAKSLLVYYKQSFDTSASFLLADPEYTREDEAFLRGLREHTLPSPDFFEAARVNVFIDRIINSTEKGRSC